MNLFLRLPLPVEYGYVASLTNPSENMNTLRGSKHVTIIYIRMSYLYPRSKCGLEIYLEAR